MAKKKMDKRQTLDFQAKEIQKLLDFVEQCFEQQIQKGSALDPAQRIDMGANVEGLLWQNSLKKALRSLRLILEGWNTCTLSEAIASIEEGILFQ